MINLKEYISPFERYCDGYGNPGASGKGYFIGLTFGIGKTRVEFEHEGTSILDEINSFDRAEVEDVNIGQINMVTVSSFCGPIGAIWGYHVLRPKNFTTHKFFPQGHIKGKTSLIPVYSASSIVDATRALFGTVEQKKFHYSLVVMFLVLAKASRIKDQLTSIVDLHSELLKTKKKMQIYSWKI